VAPAKKITVKVAGGTLTHAQEMSGPGTAETTAQGLREIERADSDRLCELYAGV
jgi:hypothetical protein